MSGSMIPLNPKLAEALPEDVRALIQSVMTPAVFKEFTGGVLSSFPIVSYRGKTWRVKQGGEEHNHVDQDGNAIQSIDVIMVRSNERPSKIFYDRAYVEGSEEPPRCWSANGIAPDADVQNPISKVCMNCPNNAWGSKISEEGKKSKACQDSRRISIVFDHALQDQMTTGAAAQPLLLRIPPATLGPLKDYVDKVLAPKGILPFILATKIGFDASVAFPKLTFKVARFLNAAEIQAVFQLRESEEVKRILAESQEFGAGGTAGQEAQPSNAAATAPAAPSASVGAATPAMAPVNTPPAPKPTAVQVEAAGDAAVQTKPPKAKKPKPAAPVTVAPATTVPVAAQPKPPPPQQQTLSPATVFEEESEGNGADMPPLVPNDLDAMLNSILGTN